jgi:protein SCO1
MTRTTATLMLMLTTAMPAAADPPRMASDAKPRELAGVEIVEKPGARLPIELPFRNQEGRAVTLKDYLDGEHPLIIVLAYYRCPKFCSIVLNGVLGGIKTVGLPLGIDYRVVTVSFDPRDTIEMAAEKRLSYVKELGGDVPPKGWDFLVGDAYAVRALAEAIGFRYRWDPATEQFAHGAGAFVFTPDGRLSRTLYGVNFPGRNVRLSLVEAGQGNIGSTWDKVILFCYHWDPNASGYTLAIVKLVRIVGLLFVLALAYFFWRLWRRERRAKAAISTSRPEQATT